MNGKLQRGRATLAEGVEGIRGGVVRGGGDQAVSNLTTLASTTSFLHPQGFFLHRRHQQKMKMMPLVVSEMRDHPLMEFPLFFKFSSSVSGLLVGDCVSGPGLGSSVGTEEFVGRGVGSGVGSAVGCGVGSGVGSAVGLYVGT